MDSKPRSTTIPVAVTVASEQEPVECEGTYTERSGGFTLEFKMGGETFFIEHSRENTILKANGVMNYDIDLNDGVTATLLSTPYGQMRFEIKTVERSIVKLNDHIKIALQYVMISSASEKINRAVDITVRLK